MNMNINENSVYESLPTQGITRLNNTQIPNMGPMQGQATGFQHILSQMNTVDGTDIGMSHWAETTSELLQNIQVQLENKNVGGQLKDSYKIKTPE